MYSVKPFEAVAWTMTPGLWATYDDTDQRVVDIYDDRDIAEAWVTYANRKMQPRANDPARS